MHGLPGYTPLTTVQLLLVLCAVEQVSCGLTDWDDYHLVWEEQFDDLEMWNHEISAYGGGNHEFQVYTDDPANSFADGMLNIQPTLLANSINPLTDDVFGDEFFANGVLDLQAMYGHCTIDKYNGCRRANNTIPPVMSARITTQHTFSFKYGRVRVRAKMPTGDWIWPAIWLMPEDAVYGSWPMSGEIDLMESRGNVDYRTPSGTQVGVQLAASTLHWGPRYDQDRFYKTSWGRINKTHNYADHWHVYEMDWSENGIRILIDGDELATYPSPLIQHNHNWTGYYDYGAPYQSNRPNPGWTTLNAPFDKEFYFILNVAVGGTDAYFPDACVNRGGNPRYAKPWSNSDPYNVALGKFREKQDRWYPTWEDAGEDNALRVDYIEVWQRN